MKVWYFFASSCPAASEVIASCEFSKRIHWWMQFNLPEFGVIIWILVHCTSCRVPWRHASGGLPLLSGLCCLQPTSAHPRFHWRTLMHSLSVESAVVEVLCVRAVRWSSWEWSKSVILTIHSLLPIFKFNLELKKLGGLSNRQKLWLT